MFCGLFTIYKQYAFRHAIVSLFWEITKLLCRTCSSTKEHWRPPDEHWLSASTLFLIYEILTNCVISMLLHTKDLLWATVNASLPSFFSSFFSGFSCCCCFNDRLIPSKNDDGDDDDDDDIPRQVIVSWSRWKPSRHWQANVPGLLTHAMTASGQLCVPATHSSTSSVSKSSAHNIAPTGNAEQNAKLRRGSSRSAKFLRQCPW